MIIIFNTPASKETGVKSLNS